MNHSNELSNVEKIKQLVDYLNLQRNAYYNENSPNISDAEYDRIFDELVELEKQTGFVLSNSPTQTVGYTPISELPKVKHPVPLLSLDKTKQVQDLISFAGKQEDQRMEQIRVRRQKKGERKTIHFRTCAAHVCIRVHLSNL